MGLFRALSNAIYKEYDRRIKRASLITDYGASHHQDDHADHDEQGDHVAEAHDDPEAAEIVNLPRGAPIVAPVVPPETHE
jgi:hypothetical protein